jgi:hypothetical protein
VLHSYSRPKGEEVNRLIAPIRMIFDSPSSRSSLLTCSSATIDIFHTTANRAETVSKIILER